MAKETKSTPKAKSTKETKAKSTSTKTAKTVKSESKKTVNNSDLTKVETPNINKSNITFSQASLLKVKGKKSDLDKFNIKNTKKGLNKKKTNSLSIKTPHNSNVGKVITIIVLLIILTLIIGVIVKNKTANKNNVYVINEDTYLQQVNEILSHKDAYIGKEISLSGIYGDYDYNGKVYKMIYRTTPGTSGNNGIAAFDINYAGETELESGDWINITGTLKSYIDETDNEEYLEIDVKKLEKIEEGNKFVTK